jgi:hypothetical protein
LVTRKNDDDMETIHRWARTDLKHPMAAKSFVEAARLESSSSVLVLDLLDKKETWVLPHKVLWDLINSAETKNQRRQSNNVCC